MRLYDASMKDANFLFQQIISKRSFLCIGLDPDIAKIPEPYKSSNTPLLDFGKSIVEQTHDLAIAFKINLAFFEKYGPKGWSQFEELVGFVPEECLIIADAKRGDIGNTSSQYAQYYFERVKVDALTLHPYMGLDSLEPFAEYREKWLIILALTSNKGAADFEMLEVAPNGDYLYQCVLQQFRDSSFSDRCMFVVGATHPQHFVQVRQRVPNHFLLVPGIGEQGGDLLKTMEYGANRMGGLIINVGRKILYPPNNYRSRSYSRSAALQYREIMKEFIEKQPYAKS